MWFNTDVSGLPIGPIFKGQAVSSVGLLRGVWWFQTNVSAIPIGPIFRGQARA